MIPAPFEVIPAGDGFTWRLIGSCGRPLVYPLEIYPCGFAAADAAREARARFCETARVVDGVGR